MKTTRTTPSKAAAGPSKRAKAPAPRLLLHGIDTIQCAYYLLPQGQAQIDFVQLRAQRESLREAKTPEPQPIQLGDMEFLLAPHGSASGYPFVLSNAEYRIEFGEFNNPSFYVTYRSEALWREPAEALHRRFLAWAAGMGFAPVRPETLSRVDFCFDYHLPVMDFEADAFVSLATKDSQHRANGAVQTFTFGRGEVVLRVYDKVAEILELSEKVWLFELWGEDRDVWRIEWQVRKEVLRRFGIRTYAELNAQAGELLRYLATEHDTLRKRTRDRNRSRWPLHPLWRDLHAQIERFKAEGVTRAIDPMRQIEERIARIGLALNGYLKHFAALRCVQRRQDSMPHDKALTELQRLLCRVHDEFTWRLDVTKRIQCVRLGE